MKKLSLWILSLRLRLMNKKRKAVVDDFLVSFAHGSHARASYKHRDLDAIDDKISALKAKIGSLSNDN